MYNKKVIDNFLNPTHAGGLKGSDLIGKFACEETGDIVKIYIKLNNETQKIEDAHFKSFGSPATIACSNIACDLLINMDLEQAKQLSNAEIMKNLGGLPMDKISSSTSVENAIHDAIENYEKKLEKLNNAEENN